MSHNIAISTKLLKEAIDSLPSPNYAGERHRIQIEDTPLSWKGTTLREDNKPITPSKLSSIHLCFTATQFNDPETHESKLSWAINL